MAAQTQLAKLKDTHTSLVNASDVSIPDGIFDPTIARRVLFTAPPNVVTLPSFEEV